MCSRTLGVERPWRPGPSIRIHHEGAKPAHSRREEATHESRAPFAPGAVLPQLLRAPLFAILALRLEGARLALAFSALAVIGLVSAVSLLWGISRLQPDPYEVSSVVDRGPEVAATDRRRSTASLSTGRSPPDLPAVGWGPYLRSRDGLRTASAKLRGCSLRQPEADVGFLAAMDALRYRKALDPGPRATPPGRPGWTGGQEAPEFGYGHLRGREDAFRGSQLARNAPA